MTNIKYDDLVEEIRTETRETKYTTEVAVNHAEFVEKRSESSAQGIYHGDNQNAPTGGFEQMGTVVEEPQWMKQTEIPF